MSFHVIMATDRNRIRQLVLVREKIAHSHAISSGPFSRNIKFSLIASHQVLSKVYTNRTQFDKILVLNTADHTFTVVFKVGDLNLSISVELKIVESISFRTEIGIKYSMIGKIILN